MSDWGNNYKPPKKEGIHGMQTEFTKGLRPWEADALKQLGRTLVVIADMLDGIPLDRVLEDIQFEAGKKGHNTKPFAHSPIRNRLLNIEKFALALRSALQVARRDIKCVCGHGFSLHQTPGAECIGATDDGTSICECDSFVVHRYEYELNRFSAEGIPDWLPCLCTVFEDFGQGGGRYRVMTREDIHPECPIHSAENDNVKKLVEAWHR